MNKIEIKEKLIEEKTDFLIEGMSEKQLNEKFFKEAKKNPNLQDINTRNQFEFITKCFSYFIQIEGKYIKGARLKDLIILYYIDYYIKNKLSERAIKVGQYLNIALTMGNKKGKIHKLPNEKQNTFGEVMHFFEKELNKKEKKGEKEYVITFMKKQYQASFNSVLEFEKNMRNIVALRNISLHHYSAVSNLYGWKVKNGEVVFDQKYKNKKLSSAVHSLCYFLNAKSSEKVIKKITNIYSKQHFSNHEIRRHVFNKAKKIINFTSLKKVSSQNIHFSVIDLMNGNYSHAKNIK